MKIVEEHVSPDRLLRLIVTRDDDGDVSIGFANYDWHTHGDILAELSGLPESAAIRQFVQRITRDDQILVVSRVHGDIQGVWPTDDPQGEFKYKPPEESLEFRLWSGMTVNVQAP
jgi:hypothetical protein